MVKCCILDMGVNFCRSNLVQLEYLTWPLTQCLLRIGHVRGIEEPAYELLQKYHGFEVRKYVDTIQARVTTSGMNYGESARPPSEESLDISLEETNDNKASQ